MAFQQSDILKRFALKIIFGGVVCAITTVIALLESLLCPYQFNEAMYPEVKQWLVENPQDKNLSKSIKQSLLHFETLTEPEKEQLQTALLAIDDLPDVIQQFMPDRLGALPVELLDMVGKHLTPQDRRELATADKRMHSVFHQSNLHAKFLECVAYGQQDKAERLLSQVFQGQPTRIQAALLHQGTLTTYPGETFNCSAYEYAYWAKDTHMCRMLERYMDDETKAAMAARIDEMERIDEATGQPIGLVYSQAGQEHRSAHFDFTPLKEKPISAILLAMMRGLPQTIGMPWIPPGGM